jgi:dTDP-glucose 4,6-dehydratase
MAAGRWGFRAIRDRVGCPEDAEKVLIYGAGDAGYQLMRLIAADRSSPYYVVGFVDDNRSKRNLRLLGVPVVGGRDKITEAAAERGASTVIMALGRPPADLVREIADITDAAALRFLVLRPLEELIGGRISLSDIREVDIADILGRRQIETNLSEIAGYLTDRVVLVTGAGGIGSELARQVHRFGHAGVLLDHDESALHGPALHLRPLPRTSSSTTFGTRRHSRQCSADTGRIVFHAATLKHLPCSAVSG